MLYLLISFNKASFGRTNVLKNNARLRLWSSNACAWRNINRVRQRFETRKKTARRRRVKVLKYSYTVSFNYMTIDDNENYWMLMNWLFMKKFSFNPNKKHPKISCSKMLLLWVLRVKKYFFANALKRFSVLSFLIQFSAIIKQTRRQAGNNRFP